MIYFELFSLVLVSTCVRLNIWKSNSKFSINVF